MKSVKLILPVVAFLLAIVTAFASDIFASDAKGIKPSNSECIVGDIQQPLAQCTTVSSSTRCTVKIVDNGLNVIVPAYTLGGTCQETEDLFFH